MTSLKSPNEALEGFQGPVSEWFSSTFEGPTEAQQQAWPKIRGGDHTLLVAPTGSGKTLAAFLVAIDRLMFSEPSKKTRVVYISPLKALGVDVERNLKTPVAGIRAAAERTGANHRVPTVGIRTGDTPTTERAKLVRNPPDILITTPESLFLMLTSKASEGLNEVETIIVDEIHSVVGTKRGAHLSLTLERLQRLVGKPVQRIGLSATLHPIDEAAKFLGGFDQTGGERER